MKTSLVVDTDLHIRWSAAAAIHGIDRNAFAVGVLREALRSIVVIDRSRAKAKSVDPDSEGVSEGEAA